MTSLVSFSIKRCNVTPLHFDDLLLLKSDARHYLPFIGFFLPFFYQIKQTILVYSKKSPKTLAVLREELWPSGTSIRDQLYGDQGQLKQTAAYITRTGLPI